jgi:hypothetical protein
VLDTIKQLILNQFEAAFCTLNRCIDKCPGAAWNSPVVNYKFCQVVFHTLFYADFYLGSSEHSFRLQSFHRDNLNFFRDYEEFENRAPQWLYDKPSIEAYLGHCRMKASKEIAAATATRLEARSWFQRLAFSRADCTCTTSGTSNIMPHS